MSVDRDARKEAHLLSISFSWFFLLLSRGRKNGPGEVEKKQKDNIFFFLLLVGENVLKWPRWWKRSAAHVRARRPKCRTNNGVWERDSTVDGSVAASADSHPLRQKEEENQRESRWDFEKIKNERDELNEDERVEHGGFLVSINHHHFQQTRWVSVHFHANTHSLYLTRSTVLQSASEHQLRARGGRTGCKLCVTDEVPTLPD